MSDWDIWNLITALTDLKVIRYKIVLINRISDDCSYITHLRNVDNTAMVNQPGLMRINPINGMS